MNTIYFVRHGENPANITREFSYRAVDYPLTPKGVEQARQTAEYFRGRPIDAVYSSPLKRAKETAEQIAAAVGRPIAIVEEFREINVGDLEGQPPTDVAWALHDGILAEWERGTLDLPFPGGEDYLTVLARAKAGIREAVRGREGQRIVVVAHGGILKAAVRGVCGAVAAEHVADPCRNCSITELAVETADGDVSGELRAWAACAHLS